MTLVVQTTAAACGSGSIQWTGAAWTGFARSTPSNPFTTLDSPVTVVNSGVVCTAQFVTQAEEAQLFFDQRITDTRLQAGRDARVQCQELLSCGGGPLLLGAIRRSPPDVGLLDVRQPHTFGVQAR